MTLIESLVPSGFNGRVLGAFWMYLGDMAALFVDKVGKGNSCLTTSLLSLLQILNLPLTRDECQKLIKNLNGDLQEIPDWFPEKLSKAGFNMVVKSKFFEEPYCRGWKATTVTLIHSENHWTWSVRTKDQRIEEASRKLEDFLRGEVGLQEVEYAQQLQDDNKVASNMSEEELKLQQDALDAFRAEAEAFRAEAAEAAEVAAAAEAAEVAAAAEATRKSVDLAHSLARAENPGKGLDDLSAQLGGLTFHAETKKLVEFLPPALVEAQGKILSDCNAARAVSEENERLARQLWLNEFR
jgi:hypothetical protein